LQIDIAQVGKVTLIISRQPFICRQPIISLGQQICCPEAEGLNTVEDLHDWLSSQHSWLPLRISPALVLLLLLLQLLVKLHSSNSFIKCVIKLAAPADWQFHGRIRVHSSSGALRLQAVYVYRPQHPPQPAGKH